MTSRTRRVSSLSLDPQVGEVRFRADPCPQRDLSTALAVFEIIDDEAWLRRAVDVEARFTACNLYSEFCPRAGFDVHIRFVQPGIFLPQPLPGKLRIRLVL